MHCPHCSKPIAQLVGACVHCGVRIEPAAARFRSTIQCPRCGVDAEIVSLGPVDVDHCAACGNMWFDNSELERASSAADGMPGTDLRDAVRALVPARVHSSGPPLIQCSFCSNDLHRRYHPTVPGVVAQVCGAHGAWLERVHLLKLLDDIETHGLDDLRTREEQRHAERAAHAQAAKRDFEEMHRKTMRRLRSLWYWVGY